MEGEKPHDDGEGATFANSVCKRGTVSLPHTEEQKVTQNIRDNGEDVATPKAGQCPHKRQRSRCKECGGAGLCEHQRRKSRCKDCGGAEICEHQRIRRQCKVCRHLRPHSSTLQLALVPSVPNNVQTAAGETDRAQELVARRQKITKVFLPLTHSHKFLPPLPPFLQVV